MTVGKFPLMLVYSASTFLSLDTNAYKIGIVNQTKRWIKRGGCSIDYSIVTLLQVASWLDLMPSSPVLCCGTGSDGNTVVEENMRDSRRGDGR